MNSEYTWKIQISFFFFQYHKLWKSKYLQKYTCSILHIYSTEVYLKYSSISAGQDTNKRLHNLWSNGLVVSLQVYQTKYPRFKTIRWLKNCFSFHPSKVNLLISRIPWDLVVKSKSSQWLCCLQRNELYS